MLSYATALGNQEMKIDTATINGVTRGYPQVNGNYIRFTVKVSDYILMNDVISFTIGDRLEKYLMFVQQNIQKVRGTVTHYLGIHNNRMNITIPPHYNLSSVNMQPLTINLMVVIAGDQIYFTVDSMSLAYN